MTPLRLVQYSTGMSSAEVAFREVEAFGAEHVVLITADTRVEDEDNWRFAIECVERMPGVRWQIVCDGRTPMQVGRDHRVVPNNRMAVCSRVLKRELLRSYIDEHHDPATCIVDLGFDAGEDGRWHDSHAHVSCVECRKAKPKTCDDHERVRCGYVDAEGNVCNFMVSEARENLWEPWKLARPLARIPRIWANGQLDDIFYERGIKPPRLYAKGASHANCGGACVRGGQADWNLLLNWNRPRYLEWEAEEELTRTMLGKDVAILRDRKGGTTVPVSLRTFRERIEAEPSLFDQDDFGACSCFGEDEDAI